MAVVTGFAIFSAGADAAPAVAEGWPRDGTFVRVTRDGGLSPFVSLYYDVTVRGSTLVVTLVKDTACRTAQREQVALLGGDEALSVIAILSEAGAWSVAPPPGSIMGRAADTAASASIPRWEFWHADGPSMTRFYVTQDRLDARPDLVRLLTAMRGLVSGLVDPLPMRDVFHPASEIGFLAMTSSEPAYAVIDGWDRVRLPLNSLDLKIGVHEVTVTGTSGGSRSFTVRIVAGETTSVHVLLDESSPSAR